MTKRARNVHEDALVISRRRRNPAMWLSPKDHVNNE